MNKFGSLGRKHRQYTRNKIILLDDDCNLYLQLKQSTNVDDPNSQNNTINLKNLKIVLNDFKGEVVNKQILLN